MIRFLDCKNGTIKDTKTGLYWQKKSDAHIWVDAVYYCKSLTLGDYTDWRLPTIQELLSIVNYERKGLAIDPIFKNGIDNIFWSSTECWWKEDFCWCVSFFTGASLACDRDFKYGVRAVRTIGGKNE